MIAESGIGAKILSWLKPIRLAGKWIISVIRLKSRVDELERQLAMPSHKPPTPPHRKCPQCGERDFRLRDTYRYQPRLHKRIRYLHQKWICYNCGHTETENIEEPM